MSTKYNKVKQYYDSGLWDKVRTRNAVIKGWITAEEYKTITQEEYKEVLV